jgi:hypothetical protein
MLLGEAPPADGMSPKAGPLGDAGAAGICEPLGDGAAVGDCCVVGGGGSFGGCEPGDSGATVGSEATCGCELGDPFGPGVVFCPAGEPSR